MAPYYPARDGHPSMFALEDSAGAIKKLQAAPRPESQRTRSPSRAACNGYRATEQNLHDLVLKAQGPVEACEQVRVMRVASDGPPATTTVAAATWTIYRAAKKAVRLGEVRRRTNATPSRRRPSR
jgi:hypothetical protein